MGMTMAQEMSTSLTSLGTFFPPLFSFYFTNESFRLLTMTMTASTGEKVQGNGHNDSPRDVNNVELFTSLGMCFFFPFFSFYFTNRTFRLPTYNDNDGINRGRTKAQEAQRKQQDDDEHDTMLPYHHQPKRHHRCCCLLGPLLSLFIITTICHRITCRITCTCGYGHISHISVVHHNVICICKEKQDLSGSPPTICHRRGGRMDGNHRRRQ